MTYKLREYIDMLFAQAPATKKAVEVKEEILQNLIDKYNDLIAEGKSEEAAYNIAIASVGDISELIRGLKGAPVYDEKRVAEDEANRQRRALITAIAIGLYVVCVVPVMLFGGRAGPILMFLIAAVATGMLVYNSMTKPKFVRAEDTMADEFKQWRSDSDSKRAIRRSVNSSLWAITLAVYFLVSFSTGQWHISWVIFLIAGAVSSVIKAFFDLKG